MPPSSPGAARLPIPAVGWGAPSSWAPRGELGRETEPRACPRGSGGACLCPHLLSCPVCDVPPTPASSLSASVSPTGLLEAPRALPICLSIILCPTLPPSLCVGFRGGGGVPRVLGKTQLDSFLRPAQKGRAFCVFSLWCYQAEGGTESPPGPRF